VLANRLTHIGLPPSPLNRRQRLAAKLMDCLEDITTRMHDGYYVDLFVRASNKTAIQMYTKVHNTGSCKAVECFVYGTLLPGCIGLCILLRTCINVVAAPRAESCFVTGQFGYTLYRRVLGYYSGEEDAYDLRKAMPRDVLQKSVVPLDRPVYPHELEHD
jgi:N-terminal acetyltransferase B complex catalytic subunit